MFYLLIAKDYSVVKEGIPVRKGKNESHSKLSKQRVKNSSHTGYTDCGSWFGFIVDDVVVVAVDDVVVVVAAVVAVMSLTIEEVNVLSSDNDPTFNNVS